MRGRGPDAERTKKRDLLAVRTQTVRNRRRGEFLGGGFHVFDDLDDLQNRVAERKAKTARGGIA